MRATVLIVVIAAFSGVVSLTLRSCEESCSKETYRTMANQACAFVDN